MIAKPTKKKQVNPPLSYDEILREEGWYDVLNANFYLLVVAEPFNARVTLAVSKDSNTVHFVDEGHSWGVGKYRFLKADISFEI